MSFGKAERHDYFDYPDRGCNVARKYAGRDVKCLECPFVECLSVLNDAHITTNQLKIMTGTIECPEIPRLKPLICLSYSEL